MSIYRYVYALPLWAVALCMLAAVPVWGALRRRLRPAVWLAVNIALLAISAAAIVHNTLLVREPGEYRAVFRPFAALAEARRQPELYRAMLMNVFLFFPFGLALSNALPRGRLPLRLAAAVLGGLALSAGIEYAQYRLALGNAETDDVICNTLGAAAGACSLFAARAFEKIHERRLRHTMGLTTTEKQFLALIRAAVSGGEASVENADWPALFSLAGQQKLLPILFEYVRGTPAAAEYPELFSLVKQQVISQVLGQTMRAAEFCSLYQDLRAAGLRPLVVKGQICSRLYPMRDHRISADDDLLIADAELAACHGALLQSGLSASCAEDEAALADETAYTKEGSPLYIELHRRLFSTAGDAHDDLNRFFLDVQPVELDGFLTLPPHEHMLYLILHAYKHFVVSGVGLRQFCDIGLWAREYCGEINWARLLEQCAAVHADVFAAAVFEIARRVLDIDFPLPDVWPAAPDVGALLHDALCGGVYGTADLTRRHSSTITLEAVRSSRLGRRHRIAATLFPPLRYMQGQFAYVKKCPFLLPAAWVQRAFRYLLETRRPDSSPASSLRLAKERIALMKQYGVME